MAASEWRVAEHGFVGQVLDSNGEVIATAVPSTLERLTVLHNQAIADAVAAEREACADLVLSWQDTPETMTGALVGDDPVAYNDLIANIAREIRARGDNPG